MEKEEITAIFDRQASSYDQKWSSLAAINGALHLLAGAVLSKLPSTSRILCVGAGTGAEILYLAQKFPGWHFTAVEPSAGMLEVLQKRVEEHGISSRCVFHGCYLDSLPVDDPFDAATTFLVSQFILDRSERVRLFRDVGERLRPGGVLLNADLAGDMSGGAGDLLEVWFRLMKGSGSLVSQEEVERMREAYIRDVAVLPPEEIHDLIGSAGFGSPSLFFQAGMIHAWYAERSPDGI